MEFKTKNREWVKNAAIIFLAVLLVLTFFSNTLMNRSLPEVATQYVSDGTITAKVRGTGTVTAIGNHQVKATENREIRAVMVRAGQEVNAGDVLFVLGSGDAAEIEAAEEALRALQVSYQRTAAGVPYYSYKLEEMEIASAKKALEAAEKALKTAAKNKSKRDVPYDQEEAAQAEVELAEQGVADAEKAVADQEIVYQTYVNAYNDALAPKQAAVDEKTAAYNTISGDVEILTQARDAAQRAYDELPVDASEEERAAAQAALDAAQAALNEKLNEQIAAKQEMDAAIADRDAVSHAPVEEQEAILGQKQAELEEAKKTLADAKDKLAAIQAVIEEILGDDVLSEEYKKAKEARDEAEKTYKTLVYNLEAKKASNAQSQALSYIDLGDLGSQIERARQKLNELTGGEENQILANVSGTVTSVECTSGDMKHKDDVLCTIEVPDMGHTLSFSVTNEQARRLRLGDEGSVSNYYWGNQVKATLSSIQTDPKNPINNKLLTFDLEGDVNSGSELTISVGQKSANYDIILPNSAIRSDSNGSFVLTVEARNSPLGNRYVARRVNVEVLASDDVNSAVTAELGYGDYVITTSSAPVKNGDLVRLADA